MPTDDPKAVHMYLHFVHTGDTLAQVTHVPSNGSALQPSNGPPPQHATPQYASAARHHVHNGAIVLLPPANNAPATVAAQSNGGSAAPSSSDSVRDQILNRYTELAMIYVLAEQLQDVRTKNAVVVKMLRTMETEDQNGFRQWPDLSAVDHVYNGTPEGNLMPQLICAQYTWGASQFPRWLRERLADVNKEFLCDLVDKLHADRMLDDDHPKFYVEDYLEDE
jgi:hypothetical protein